ncbi:MAG: restriction endonuclease subunit S [Vicinamibacterales bacterium]
MATLINERVDNPAESGVERYVGLEHLDADSLRIRRWGEITDVDSTKLRFQSGDIIFGKRRVYQRKLAVADFDGICSAHAMVLRAKANVVLPEFLPFFMQSERFMERALAISVGSLSPTINWTTLAAEEFALPPVEEQRRMANALAATIAASEAQYRLRDASIFAMDALIDSQMRGAARGCIEEHARVGRFHGRWPIVPLKEVIVTSQYGLSDVASDSGDYAMLRMMNIKDGYAVENDLKYIDLKPQELERYRLHRGDVLFNRTNSYDLVGRTGVYELEGEHVFASYLVRLRTQSDRLDPAYLSAFLNAPIGRRQVMSYATRAVSQTNVNASSLGRVLIPLPPLDYQLHTVSVIRGLAAATASATERIDHLQRVVRAIAGAGGGE